MKRFLSTLLAVCMVLTLLPTPAFAEDETIVASGECGAQGDNLTWTLDSEGTLIISGQGEMADYIGSFGDDAPWNNYRKDITVIKINDGVTSIGHYTFIGCYNLIKVTVPDGVTSIGIHAFYGCHKLVEINIPDSVVNIERAAFYECYQLSQITIPNGVTNISNFAFRMCRSLTEITIPNSVTNIGDCAFGGCYSLTEINIPDSVIDIGYGAFGDCKKLISINVSTGNQNYCSEDGVLISADRTVLFCFPSGKSDPHVLDGITKLGSYAFWGCNSLSRITIPDGVTDVDVYVFEDCPNLSEITLPASITFIAQQGHGAGYKNLDVYYDGSRHQWDKITIIVDQYPHTSLRDANVHFALNDIIYDANGGTGIMDDVQVNAGGTFVLPSCGFTAPAGKAFKAWSIGGVEYAPGVTLDITIDTTVTAIWKDVDAPITPPEDPDKYTVSYNANGGSGTMDSVLVEEGESYTLPACGFTAPTGKEFKTWQIGNAGYNPNDVYTVTADTTVTAVWQTIPTVGYTLTGTITGHKGVTYASVTAQLVGLNGSTYSAEVGARVVDKTGKTEYAYTVAAPAGQYTLEVEARTDTGGVVNRSAVVKLTGNGQTKDINLPNGQAKVKVENKIETAALVGGLDELIIDADGEVNGEVTLTIGSVDNSDPSVAAIRNAALGRTLEFMDISITKSENGVESAVTDTGDVTVEIVLAFDRTGKNDIAVYRYHDGNVDTLTTQVSGDGEKVEVDDDSIAIYAKKFSVYAIGYTVPATNPVIPSNPTTPSYSSGDSNSDPTYSINIPSRVTGGTVKVTPTRASAGSKVTITAKPTSGYEVGTVTVADKDGNEITVTDAGDGKYTFVMPKSKVDVKVEFVRQQTIPSFTDVQSGAYYADAVAWAVERGITVGTSATTFSPDASCTRAQIVTFLWRAAGSPKATVSSPFTDVPVDSYYYDAVLWAVEHGITRGTSATTFSPDASCTRAEAVTFLYRYEKSPAVSGSNTFTDVVADTYYSNAVQWAVNKNVTAGTSPTTFSPNATCTRGHIVTFLYRDMA